jgi:DNA-binding HxlR family transcriptional regulator
LTRFDQFRKSLGIAPTILTRRLAVLTQEGLLEKHLYMSNPPREEYLLTDAGRDFLPVLFMIGAWGRRHRGGGKLVRFFDAETDTEIQAVAIDEITGAKIGSRPIRLVNPHES